MEYVCVDVLHEGQAIRAEDHRNVFLFARKETGLRVPVLQQI
jgi:hypothetical protein